MFRALDSVAGMLAAFAFVAGAIYLFMNYWWVLVLLFIAFFLYGVWDRKQETEKWEDFNARLDRAADAYWENRQDGVNELHMADRETRNAYYREFMLNRVSR